MGATEQEIADVVRRFLANHQSVPDPSFFGDDRPLVTSGILDSITIMLLITFLEQTYPVEFMAFELSIEYLDTVGSIARTVHEKLEGGR